MKKLLILDLDETLIYAMPNGGGYDVSERPHLAEFLVEMASCFEVAIWSAGSRDYVDAIVSRSVVPRVSPVFVWANERCTCRRDPDTWDWIWAKPLAKVKRRGYKLADVLIVEDDPLKVRGNYGNAIYVQPYFGAESDDDLYWLKYYLPTLAEVPDVRRIEKRGWRKSAKWPGLVTPESYQLIPGVRQLLTVQDDPPEEVSDPPDKTGVGGTSS